MSLADITSRPWSRGSRPVHEVSAGQGVVRLLVAYDGAAFSGVVEQPQRPTVAGVLLDAMERVLGSRPRLAVAGRTDAGVHAYGQVFSSVIDKERGRLDRLAGAIRGAGPAVELRRIEWADESFHARFSAITRRYRYLVRSAPCADPLRANIEWHVRDPVELARLRATVEAVIGDHDFAAFCRQPPPARWRGPGGELHEAPGSTRRIVSDARWSELADGTVLFEIEASSFCQQMVRSLVGAMVDVGRGRLRAAEFRDQLRTPERHSAAGLAPAHGLALVGVRYGDGFGEPFIDPTLGGGGLPAGPVAP